MFEESEQPTKWSIIASGEGADRIALQYHTGFHNMAIEDRVLLLNTAAADVHPEKIFDYLIKKDVKFLEISEKIKRERICIFGSAPGAGNVWKVGEMQAREDFDTIRRYISNLKIIEGDVILTINTLGGGTGNGSTPYLINELKYGKALIAGHKNKFFSVGVLPFDVEPPQRHFNAICGMTRLLKYPTDGKDWKQNTDLLILVNNSQIENKIASDSYSPDKILSDEERYYLVNKSIIDAIDIMIAPGGKTSKTTVDVADYHQIPSNLGVYHFTPCIATGLDPEIIDVETAIDFAVKNPMVPLDIKTATMAYFIMRVPKKYIGKRFSQEELERITKDWAVNNMCGSTGGIARYASLTYTTEQENFDILVLLGGFSLKEVIRTSLHKYEIFSKGLEDKDIAGENALTTEDALTIEEKIKNYIKHTEDVIKIVSSGEDEGLLEKWGF